MTANWIDNQKNLMLFSGRAHPELAEQVAKELDIRVTPQTARDFANGEIFVRFEESVPRLRCVSSCRVHPAPLNTWGDGAAHHDRRSQAWIGKAHHRRSSVLPVRPPGQEASRTRADLRSPDCRPAQDRRRPIASSRSTCIPIRSRAFSTAPVDHMHAHSQLANHIRAGYNLENITVVSPDSGRVRVAEKWADSLGGAPLAFIHKTRDPLVPNQVKSNRVVGEVEGRTCILIDDMIDTGGTIAGAVKVLQGGRCR